MKSLVTVFFSIIVRHIFIRVHTKIKFCCKCVHSQVIRDVDESVSSSDLEKCSIASLSNGCSAVNGCRQNESPNTRCDGADPGGGGGYIGAVTRMGVRFTGVSASKGCCVLTSLP